jgi:hypothetical protein
VQHGEVKIPLFVFGLLVYACTATCQGQSVAFAKFAGEYIGVASPSKWVCDERALIDVYVYPDGTVEVYAYTYDLNFSTGGFGTGTLDAKGRFAISVDTGFVVSGKVSASGTVRGTAIGACKYTYAALRRFKAPFDPAL